MTFAARCYLAGFASAFLCEYFISPEFPYVVLAFLLGFCMSVATMFVFDKIEQEVEK